MNDGANTYIVSDSVKARDDRQQPLQNEHTLIRPYPVDLNPNICLTGKDSS